MAHAAASGGLCSPCDRKRFGSLLSMVEIAGMVVPMRRLIVGMILGLALPACTSAPAPEQPAEADWAPCGGHKFSEGTTSYARCIKYVATPAEADSAKDTLQAESRFGEERGQNRCS